MYDERLVLTGWVHTFAVFAISGVIKGISSGQVEVAGQAGQHPHLGGRDGPRFLVKCRRHRSCHRHEPES